MIKNIVGWMLNKKNEGEALEKISISDECLSLLEKLKPPFESTDQYLNRLIKIQEKYNQQEGKEFVNMVFNDTFLSCTKEYLDHYQSNKKKEHIVESTKTQVKQSITDLFNANEDTILALLMLIDESISLLFQTDFSKILSQYYEKYQDE